MPAYKYKAEHVRTVDGDTVRFRVDLGFRMTYLDNFRLTGINAPELREKGGKDSKMELDNLLKGADSIYVIITKHGKYRWLCRIDANYGEKKIDVNQWMIDQGFAKEYK